jgi:hypothetical protein
MANPPDTDAFLRLRPRSQRPRLLHFLYDAPPNLHGLLTHESLSSTGVRVLMISDVIYIGLSLLLFGLTWGFARLCERV